MIECIQVTAHSAVLKIIYQTENNKEFPISLATSHLYILSRDRQRQSCTALTGLTSHPPYCTLVFGDDIRTVVQLQLSLVLLVVEELQL